MAKEQIERRLAVILAADIVGYSRMMEVDEEATLAVVNAHLSDLIKPCIAEHRGRIFKTMGDGLLAEFSSAVDAIRCAIAIQHGMFARNAGLQENQCVVYRIGVNFGDVMVQEGDVFGDSVNIAARLEALAEPGGLCLSEDVYRQVHGKVECEFEDIGPKQVKNIAEPVHTFRVLTNVVSAPIRPTDKTETITVNATLPSIAVLPFQNMSSDPEQEYFADGMVEEIITALSRFTWLLVMSRNSSFTYKGRAVDVRQVADELSVRYVLEGSVRRAGERIRITGQLIDATTGIHLWADRFDGDIEDIFDLQDKITACVVGAIEPSLRKAEIERARRKRPENLAAYELYLRALIPLNRMRPEANTEALEFLERAIKLEPAYAPALAYAAWCHEQRLIRSWSTTPESDIEAAVKLAREALAIDSGDAAAIAMAGFVLTVIARDYDNGHSAAQRALDLNPNSATVCWMAGWTILFASETQSALPIFERAFQLSPSDPQAHFLLNGMSMCHLMLNNPTQAFEYTSKSVALYADLDVTYYILIPACGYLGRIEDAKKAIAKLQSLEPGITISSFEHRMPFRNREHLNIVLEGLRMAGLPE